MHSTECAHSDLKFPRDYSLSLSAADIPQNTEWNDGFAREQLPGEFHLSLLQSLWQRFAVATFSLPARPAFHSSLSRA